MKARMLLATLLTSGAIALSGAVVAQTPGGGTQSQMGQSQMGQSQGAMQPSDMSQEQVRQIQQALKEAGHDIEVDGMWGPNTQSALREFQQAKGLQATGQPTPETMAELNVDMSGQSGGGMSGSSGGGGSMSGSGDSQQPPGGQPRQ